jgi:hypothetical protein
MNLVGASELDRDLALSIGQGRFLEDFGQRIRLRFDGPCGPQIRRIVESSSCTAKLRLSRKSPGVLMPPPGISTTVLICVGNCGRHGFLSPILPGVSFNILRLNDLSRPISPGVVVLLPSAPSKHSIKQLPFDERLVARALPAIASSW